MPSLFCGVTNLYIDCGVGEQTKSPSFGDEDPRRKVPRFQRVVDRAHPLWRVQANVDEISWASLSPIIREMEANCVKVVGISD